MLKLRSSIVLKTVNANCIYALDCEDESSFFFKFEGVSKIFIEYVHKGTNQDKLLSEVKSFFPDVSSQQIEGDFEDFLQTIRTHKLLAP